jgi:MFS family permease
MRNSIYYPWLVVGLLWFVALLNYLDRQMLSTMQSSMQIDIQELAIAENFGRIMGIFLLIYGLMSPVAGLIADRVNRKWLIIGSLFIWSAVTWGMGYAETYNQVYWLRALMGVSEALYLPTGLAMIADFHSSKTRSLAIGIHMSGLYTGQALGGFGATIAANFSWNTVFHWFGIIGIIYSVILIFLLHDKKGRLEIESSKLNKEPQVSPVKKETVIRSGLCCSILWLQVSPVGQQKTGFPHFSLKIWESKWQRLVQWLQFR